MKKSILILIGLFLFDSCAPEVFEKKLTENYYLKKVDLNDMQFIGKLNEPMFDNSLFNVVIPDYVYAVGVNDKIIIAKRHPTLRPNSRDIDVNTTEYYIVDLLDASNSLYGPLERNKFESKVKELNGELIEFDINYPESKK